MPKRKPHNGLQKRVKITAAGNVLRQRSCAGHLMSKKSGSRRRQLRRKALVQGRFAERIRRALGHG